MGRRGILHGGRVRALAAVAALVACILAWPADGQVVCTGGGCGGGGAVTSPVATDPISFTGAATFDNAANTPVTLSDGAAGGTLCSGGVADTAASVCVGSGAITAEGATADASETVLAFGDATADGTLTATAISTSGIVGYKLAASGAADVAIELAPTGTTGSGVVIPAGTATNTALRFGAYTAGVGLFYNGGVYVSDGSNAGGGIQSGGFHVSKSVGGLAISSGTSASTGYDTYLTRSAAGEFLVSGNGSSTLGVIKHGFTVETVAATKTPSMVESGEIYTNGADVDGQAITLTNDPTVGTCFQFALTSTDTSNSFAIAPSAGETLMDAATTCSTSFSATAKGATARICAVSGGSGALWLVMSKNGTWTCS